MEIPISSKGLMGLHLAPMNHGQVTSRKRYPPALGNLRISEGDQHLLYMRNLPMKTAYHLGKPAKRP